MLNTDPAFRYNGRYGNGKIFQFAPRQYPGKPNPAKQGISLSGVDGGASLPGCGAQNRRGTVVRRYLAGSMG